MNSISISGRLVYETKLTTLSTGSTVIKSRIAVTRNDKNKTTDFFNIQAWNKTAEFINKYFAKGDPIEITGKLQTESYTKQDGTKVDGVYIYVSEVSFPLSKKTEAPAEPAQPEPTQDAPVEILDSDLPFQI